MPIIAKHHASDPWQPLKPWPDNCHVQWGDRGLVLGREKSYSTAFFEAFPKDGSGGFIRGEGETLEAAEASAFASYERQHACVTAGGHRWTRSKRLRTFQKRLRKERQVPEIMTYTNGGCFCLRCNAFATALPAVPSLGDWRTPLSFSELDSIMSGLVRPNPALDGRDSEEERKRSALWRRRLELRARFFGIELPDHRLPQYQRDEEAGPRGVDPYEQACRDAVARFYLRTKEAAATTGGLMVDFFDSMSRRHIEEAVRELTEREAMLAT